MAKRAYVWDGTEWVPIANEYIAYPDQSGNDGKFLHTDGSITSWQSVFESPTFTGSVTVPTPINETDAANKSYVDSKETISPFLLMGA